MRVNVISDLHLEFGDLELPGGDVLIVSGDACESRTLSRYKYDPLNILGDNGIGGKRLDRAARFFKEECSEKYRKTIYVMGNHEHYHSKFHKTYTELAAELPENVHLLERGHIEIDGVLFLGATLWTDCNRGDPLCINTLQYGMSDYKAITYLDAARSVYRKLLPRDTIDDHHKSKQYIAKMCEENRGKQIVVCTHHAPSYASIAPHWVHDRDFNGGYASDLSNLILDNPEIKVWTHGHMHDPSDYMIGDCRVICNPRGYKGHEHQADTFTATAGFDI